MNVITTVMEIAGAACVVAGVFVLAGIGWMLLVLGVALVAGSWAVNR